MSAATRYARIQTVTNAYIRTYSDSGQTMAYVEWVDDAGNKGRTEGNEDNPHIQALLNRATREGVTIERQTW